MALRKRKEMELAKLYFLAGQYTQKEIAEKCDVTEKTLTKWIKDGKWETLKKSLLTTKQSQLSELYNQLENINNEIKTRPIVYDFPQFLLKPIKVKDEMGAERLEYPEFTATDYPIKIGNVASSKDADIISKITASIKRLETETSIGDTVEVARAYIEFVSAQDLELAKKITGYFDLFINDKMK